MALEIRKIEEKDIGELYELFGGRKSMDLLSWVYGHPSGGGHSGLVAVEDDRIVGAVGFVKSKYMINGTERIGIIPLSWEVVPEARGMAGVKLLMSALKGAEFYMGMDGSEEMKQIFARLRFSPVGEARSVTRVLRPFIHFRSLDHIGPRDLLRLLRDIYQFLFRKPKKTEVIELKPLKNYSERDRTHVPGIFYNPISPDHLEWLLKNPGMQAHVFSFTIGSNYYVPLLCFIRETKPGLKRAEIVHIPPLLEKDENMLPWVIQACETFLFEKGVTRITCLVSNQISLSAFKRLGYRVLKRIRPVVVKGKEEAVEALSGAGIHLSLAESDKSVRSI